MTKKDYIKLARVLAAHHPTLALAYDIADMLTADNPRFDRDRFLVAVYGVGNVPTCGRAS